ncbi:hypothetical protein CCR80_03415 [Rhodothalassium salexigens]|nr:hypothetical protein [Rhodothalassium salexigens]
MSNLTVALSDAPLTFSRTLLVMSSRLMGPSPPALRWFRRAWTLAWRFGGSQCFSGAPGLHAGVVETAPGRRECGAAIRFGRGFGRPTDRFRGVSGRAKSCRSSGKRSPLLIRVMESVDHVQPDRFRRPLPRAVGMSVAEPIALDGLADLAGRYRGVICDVWGVLHNGQRLYPGVGDALAGLRANMGPVVLLSNAPKSARTISSSIAAMGLPATAYDRVMSSGSLVRDVLRTAIAKKGGPIRVLFIGKAGDREIIEDLDVTVTDDAGAADLFLACGFDPGYSLDLAPYEPTLRAALGAGHEMICANPDRWAPSGDRLAPCAGLFADRYETMGGRALRCGKPFAEAFEAAIEALSGLADRPLTRREILVIGDGPETDIAGAERMGLDCVLIESGLHSAPGGSAAPAPRPGLARHRPTYTLESLRWRG